MSQTVKPVLRIPGGADRTAVIGMNGTGKTVLGAWLLSEQNFNLRPWCILDFKNEELWDKVGDPPIRPLKLGAMPGKRGCYRIAVRPGQEEELEDWLWKVWAKENIGIFCDEVSLIPKWDAFKSILRQGRSKRIPVIACTQRPVDCDREVFTESTYMSIFQMKDVRDIKIIQGFTGNAPIDRILPEHCSYWLDVRRNQLLTLKPCPSPDSIAAKMRIVVPYSHHWFL